MYIKNKILILFAHPAIYKSRVNKRLIDSIRSIEGTTFHDLYETYPDFYIDIDKEQKLLKNHEIIVFHHPLYWYSSPAIIKEWMDLVLEFGFAYGPNGTALSGKKLMNVITTGGGKEAYTQDGLNKHTIREFLITFEQTANLCNMQYLPPLVIHDAIKMDVNLELHQYAELYKNILILLRDDNADFTKINEYEYINDYYIER